MEDPRELIRIGLSQHRNAGNCPDAVNGWDLRDVFCEGCEALCAADRLLALVAESCAPKAVVRVSEPQKHRRKRRRRPSVCEKCGNNVGPGAALCKPCANRMKACEWKAS